MLGNNIIIYYCPYLKYKLKKLHKDVGNSFNMFIEKFKITQRSVFKLTATKMKQYLTQ